MMPISDEVRLQVNSEPISPLMQLLFPWSSQCQTVPFMQCKYGSLLSCQFINTVMATPRSFRRSTINTAIGYIFSVIVSCTFIIIAHIFVLEVNPCLIVLLQILYDYQHRYGMVSLNPGLWKTKTRFACIVNTITSDNVRVVPGYSGLSSRMVKVNR